MLPIEEQLTMAKTLCREVGEIEKVWNGEGITCKNEERYELIKSRYLPDIRGFCCCTRRLKHNKGVRIDFDRIRDCPYNPQPSRSPHL